jgi:hypothetical protein
MPAPSRSARPLGAILLLGTLAGLAALDWHLYTAPIDISPVLPQARTPGGKVHKDGELANPLDDKPLVTFEETIARPLFHADRRPIPRKDTAEAPAAPALNTDMQLIGIAKSDGAPARALIRFAGEQMGKWVGEDETVNGWHVRAVKPLSVVVEGSGQTYELKLPAVARSTGENDGAPDAGQPNKTR